MVVLSETLRTMIFSLCYFPFRRTNKQITAPPLEAWRSIQHTTTIIFGLISSLEITATTFFGMTQASRAPRFLDLRCLPEHCALSLQRSRLLVCSFPCLLWHLSYSSMVSTNAKTSSP
jgi:hypothetical protein